MTGASTRWSGMVSSRRDPTLRSQSIGVGLLAVRSRAAVKRALGGHQLSDRDRAELDNVREVLKRTAEALSYGVTSSSAPGRRQLTSVGLALSSITPAAEVPDRKRRRGFSRLSLLTSIALLRVLRPKIMTLLMRF